MRGVDFYLGAASWLYFTATKNGHAMIFKCVHLFRRLPFYYARTRFGAGLYVLFRNNTIPLFLGFDAARARYFRRDMTPISAYLLLLYISEAKRKLMPGRE